MPEFHVTLQGQHVIQCDSCGQVVKSEVYSQGQGMRVEREHERYRQREGWQLWLSRSRRWYCPMCEPKPGHRMRQIKR